MTKIPNHFHLPLQPLADPDAIVLAGNARFTVLTARLLRLEYAPNGRFEDRASQLVWYRQQPVPQFTTHQADGWLTIETEHLQVRYQLERPFAPDTLTISGAALAAPWHFGQGDVDNLQGTTRTLDTISGSIQLEPGLLSRAGWTVIDDSHTLVFNEDGWLEVRQREATQCDFYFLGYGRDYAACLSEYGQITGNTPLLPRWALGNWWSRYWEYSADDLKSLMQAFQAHNVPLSVCIVDMDWHLVNVGEGISGWTGYTWNTDLFPDPPAFVAWLHQQGLKTSLNLHPALGIRPYEAQYGDMAKRLGIDPASQETIDFNIADPDFANAYFDLLHHPQEADGIDFWWMDWQQGELTQLPGLDPLWWLNHLHFYDLARDGDKRPFIFSRWGGLGNHRYPIGFSGDTHVDWPSFDFQPYFTATAANVGYGWWSHDIGGHMWGQEDAELYARWVQFGAFSPILRLHSTKNAFHDRRPWGFDNAEVENVARDAMQLRHALIPYLYTMSWQNAQTNQPPIRPMYHDHPQETAAYACPQQYTFGSELIAAPFTQPAAADTQLARQAVWLPAGDWYHFFTGEYFAGDSWQAQYGRLRDIPVFAKAGAIVPLAPKVGWGGVANPSLLDVFVFAGADNVFVLYEDDGETLAYKDGRYALTSFTQSWSEPEMTVTIAAVQGDASVVPTRRSYQLHLVGVRDDVAVTALLGETAVAVESSYDAQKETLIVSGIALESGEGLTLRLTAASDTLLSRRDRTLDTAAHMLRAFRLDNGTKEAVYHQLAAIRQNPELLERFHISLSDAQRRALLEVLTQAGWNEVAYGPEAGNVVLWNNQQRPDCAYHLTIWRQTMWQETQRFEHMTDTLSQFALVPIDGDAFEVIIRYGR